MIPYGKHSISQSDIEAVIDTLENSFLTQGNKVPAFEQAICQYVGANYAVATNSATSALHIACLGLGLTSEDIGWTVPLTFAASANAMRYCGAQVDFVDIDLATGCISVGALAQKIEQAASENRLPKVLIVVHYSGISCDMEAIAKLCQPYDIKIIEDASHAIGGKYQNKIIGNCQHSDCTIFSFHPVKIITSGEGGMVVTNNEQLAQQMKLFSSHGITKSSTQSAEPWLYQQQTLGFNYRLSDIHAALGLSQLSKLDSFVEQRNKIAQIYNKELSPLPIKLLSVPNNSMSAWHIYVIKLTEQSKITREELFNKLHQAGIGCQVHYIPVHTHPYYRNLGFDWGQFPNAEKFYQNCLTIPLFPSLEEKQEVVIQELTRLLE